MRHYLILKNFKDEYVTRCYLRFSGLPSRILNLYSIKWALAFVCFSFFFSIFFWLAYVCYIKLISQLLSPR